MIYTTSIILYWTIMVSTTCPAPSPSEYGYMNNVTYLVNCVKTEEHFKTFDGPLAESHAEEFIKGAPEIEFKIYREAGGQ